MNQGKLEVAKQEMTRVNINILGISKLRWTGMGEFNSDDHFICYCGQESLRRNGVAIIVTKRVQNAVLGCNIENVQNDLCSFPRQTISKANFVSKANFTVIEVYTLTSKTEEAEVEQFYEYLQDLL